MYCPVDLVKQKITSQVPAMIEVFQTSLVDPYWPECSPIVDIFNMIRLVHAIAIFSVIFVLIIGSFVILYFQKKMLSYRAYNLQVNQANCHPYVVARPLPFFLFPIPNLMI